MSEYAQEAAFARSREAFAQAEGWLAGPEAARLDHAALEEQLAARGREIRQRLLQDHLDARAAAEPRRAQVTGPDGIVRTRAEAGIRGRWPRCPGRCGCPGLPTGRPARAIRTRPVSS